jgi:hypothetical protein
LETAKNQSGGKKKMDDPKQEPADAAPVESDALARRDFLAGLGKWSAVVIGGVTMAGIFGLPRSAEAGGGWVNRRGGGGGGWVNGRGGGGGWVNRRGGGGGWVNYR